MQQFACDTDSFSGATGRGVNGRRPFPFLDPASQAIPRTWREIYEWGRLVLMRSPEFMDAHRKLFSYFATDLDVSSADADDQSLSTNDIKNWKDVMERELNIKQVELETGISVALFGSHIVTVQNRHYRQLVCPHPDCGRVTDMINGAINEGIEFKYRDNKFVFRCPKPDCPNKGKHVVAIVKDWSRRSPSDLKIKQWPADEMMIDHYLWTDRDEIYWKIPEYYKAAVRKGHLETLAEADLDVLQAIKDNTLFKFFRERVYHAKELTIAGSQVRGRSIPRSLLLAPQIWHLQLLRHQNQVLSMDYLIPLGFFSLEDQPRSSEFSGPVSTVNPNQFAADMQNMFRRHRMDPTERFAVNYAVRYQIAGGEASQLVPVPMIAAAKEDIYDASGVPLEMYRGSLNIQVMPVAARLFESSQQSIPAMYNGLVKFVARRTAEELSKPQVDIRHSRSSVVADITRMQSLWQGRQLGDVSKYTLYDGLGLDVDKEQDRTADETLSAARTQKELEEKMNRYQLTDMMRQVPPTGEEQAQGGSSAGAPQQGSSAGVLPSQGINVAGMSIDDMSAEAERIASMLVDPTMPQAQVRQELRAVKSESPQLHALVTKSMESLRQTAASQGQQAVLSGQV